MCVSYNASVILHTRRVVMTTCVSIFRLVLVSLYEEKELVKKWKMVGDGVLVDPSLRRLRRKLLVREVSK